MAHSHTYRLALAAAAVAATMTAVACGRGTNSSSPVTGEAAEVTTLWSNAFASADAAALAALYADDARSLPPGGPALSGRRDIAAYWRDDIGLGGTTTTLTPTDAVSAGNLVQVQGTYEVTGKDRAELARGQYQQLWTRSDGGWRVRQEMWRMDPAAQRSTELADQLTSLWTHAYNNADVDALVALYDEDAVLSTAQEGSIEGRRAIGQYWRHDVGDSKPSSTLTLTDTYVSGNLAHLEGEYKVADSGTITEGRYVQLWMREGDRWGIHREMWWR